MMSLAEIHWINRKLTRDARGREPSRVTAATVSAYLAGDHNALHIPYVGDRTPRGFRRVGAPWFVDASGWGSDSEPALTLPRFLDQLPVPCYVGVVKGGQFQVYIQVFQKTHAPKTS